MAELAVLFGEAGEMADCGCEPDDGSLCFAGSVARRLNHVEELPARASRMSLVIHALPRQLHQHDDGSPWKLGMSNCVLG